MAASAIYARRWFIIVMTVLAGLAGVGIALALPKWYQAEARVLLPEGGLNASALLNGLAPGVGALLGSSGGGYTRYLAILTSRSVMEDVVERFNLEEVYETQEAPAPRAAATELLRENASFDVSLDYNYLAIRVLDQSPERSAQITNYFVDRLNEENTRLVADVASQGRVYLERRIAEAEAAMDSLLTDLQALQEQYGVVQPETQGNAAFAALAQAQGAVAEAAVQVEALRAEYGPDNPLVESAEAGLAEARRQASQLVEGNASVLPVPLRRLPAVGRQYATLQQELTVQAEVLRALQPLYEQAVMEESQQRDAVQVLDRAVPPALKAKPQRFLVVIGIALSTFVLACAYVLALAWWSDQGATIRRRLEET